MNVRGQDDTAQHVDAKIDVLMEKLKALSQLVDTASDQLIRRDAETVRRAFQAKEGTPDGG